MDVDPGSVVLPANSHCGGPVRIPYSLIPGMDISSSAYYKAVSVLSKQVHARTICLEAGSPVLPLMGARYSIFSSLACLASVLDDPISSAISAIDHDSVKRARDVLSDVIMSEIIDEDPKAQESFSDSLRHQIVITCQRLRVYLHLTDRLMDLFNQSIASTSKPAV
jgi:hypothetical protein